ncbi:MAG: glycosyltransferase family 2 protein [Nocardioides sp.]|nr:glycosyltransferase family 2 protein [Nocardioides sp.]
MGSSVAALLVSHDGARWLPSVIEGLQAQRTPVDDVVVVDTTSRDGSADLLHDAFGEVVSAPGATSFPAAVALGLDELHRRGSTSEWVWILHDDANPDPGALAALLAAAAADPGVDILGPKLREWPSLKRLLELGVTISATGRRQTGLERGEYDQGQHDEIREVLAVNTAGMLVRRAVLEGLGGLDPQLPIFGNDIDFGWRAAMAGHRTVVVPDAVVFHAEAAHRGLRRTPLTGRHTHYQERRAALYTLLVNARRRSLLWLTIRLAFGTVLRMMGFLLVRAVGEALDDLAALLSIYTHPGEVRAARRARRARGPLLEERARPLLAPWWLPYRHGLDFLGDLVTAATNQAQDVAERRRIAAAQHAPASTVARPRTEEDELAEDTGAVARFLTNPVALVLAIVVLAALVGGREALGSVAGGGLSPTPAGASDWWRLHTETWHQLGTGTAVPAPPYLLPLALLATLLGGSASAAVSVVLVLAVPVGLWGAWRFLRVVGRLVTPAGAPRWALLWGSVTWALVPVVSGGWGDGRLGVVVVAALLPWLAHAALGFADPDADRRWRAAWRTGLLLAVSAAFAPVLWLFAVLLGLVVLAAAFAIVRGTGRDRSVWGPPATALGLVPLLLAPWWIPAIQRGAAEALVLDVGRLPGPEVDGLGLLSGRLGDLGAPWWLGVVLAVLAVLALVPRTTRIPVLVCWVVAAVAAVLAAALAAVTVSMAATSAEAGLGALVVVLQGALVVAVTTGAITAGRAGASWRRVVAVGLALMAAAVPVGGLAWWLGGADPAIADGIETDIPVYMVQSSESGAAHGILVVRGSVEDGLTFTVRRGDGVTLGEDEILDLTGADTSFTAQVRELVSRPTPGVIDGIAQSGIEYVVLPSPADGDVAAVLDAAPGLVQASAEDRSTRAWQVGRPLDSSALEGPTSWLRVLLLVVQGAALLVVAVLCLPTTNRRRSS